MNAQQWVAEQESLLFESDLGLDGLGPITEGGVALQALALA
jgi:hypothetical protein